MVNNYDGDGLVVNESIYIALDGILVRIKTNIQSALWNQGFGSSVNAFIDTGAVALFKLGWSGIDCGSSSDCSESYNFASYTTF